MTNRKNRLEWRLRAQRKWIEEHGNDLAGYVDRYGEPDDAHCNGNGGEAIYRADVDELHNIERQLARFHGTTLARETVPSRFNLNKEIERRDETMTAAMTITERRYIRILQELTVRLEQQSDLIRNSGDPKRSYKLDDEVFAIRWALGQIEAKPTLPPELQRLGELFDLIRGDDPSPAERQLTDRSTE